MTFTNQIESLFPLLANFLLIITIFIGNISAASKTFDRGRYRL